MSKSKKNVVDPTAIIAGYGADASRLFMLSDSPPERDMDWTEAGIDGAWRYVQRFWRLIDEAADGLPAPGSPPPTENAETARALRRRIHQTIAGVTEDLTRLHLNKAVARIRELTNALGDAPRETEAERWALREGLEAACLLFAPTAPHLAEECWRRLGHRTLVAQTAWPDVDARLLVADTLTLPVQVNGKRRGEIEAPADADEASVRAAALALPAVAKILNGAAPRRVIVVPKKIINVVA